ncbi:MAG: M20/M25/M40 family metallo-hydrolase [Bacteroidales bacterium]
MSRLLALCMPFFLGFALWLVCFPALAGLPVNEGISESARLLSAYVQFASETGNEKEAAEFLAETCREKGLYVRVFTDERDSYNFASSLYPLELGKPNVIFLNHVDVVPAGEKGAWSHPPYSGAISDGFVWGRGAIDNKAQGVMQLLSLSAFVDIAWDQELPYNFTLLTVSGEETGGEKGAAHIAAHFLHELNPVVVFGEGGTGVTGVLESDPDQPFFGISVAQKRGVWFSLESGAPEFGHGSVPLVTYPTKELILASSALVNARQPTVLTPLVKDMFHLMGSHEKGLRGLVLRNIGFFRHFLGGYIRRDPMINALLSNTMTLTCLGGHNGSYNQVAHNAWASFDSRLLPGIDSEDFIRKAERRIDGYDVGLKIINKAPKAPVSEKGPFYYALEEAVVQVFGDVVVTPILFPAHNDNVFFRERGIPAYGLLPAIMELELIESIHNVDERMPIEGLDYGIAVYQALIRNLIEL